MELREQIVLTVFILHVNCLPDRTDYFNQQAAKELPTNNVEDGLANKNTTALVKRLYYCAFLIDEHIGFLEKTMSNGGMRKEDFKKFWQNANREKEKMNLQALEKFDNTMKDRISHFVKRSQDVIEKCFDTNMSFRDEVDPTIVKEISKIRDKNAIDAKEFFLQEIPQHLYRLITSWGALNTSLTTTTQKVPTTSRKSSPNWNVDTS